MKNAFITPLDVTPLPDGVRWRLDSPLTYIDLKGVQIIVPKGFVTDFASIPPLSTIGAIVQVFAFALMGWMFVPGIILLCAAWFVIFVANGLEHEGTYDEAACLHDWLYSTHCRSFTESNWLLFKAMIAKGSGKTVFWKRVVIWLAVSCFGWLFWKKKASRKVHTSQI